MAALYGLVGFPLGHSFSPQYFEDKFRREGIDACYERFELHEIHEVGTLLKERPDLAGFNVTIPYKQAIMGWLHCISPEASLIGAVNCVRVCRIKEVPFPRLIGYNTDAPAFYDSLTHFLGDMSTYPSALILGNGGAAQAVRHTLDKLRIPHLTVSRTPNAQGLIGYDNLSPALLKKHMLIVNTTPLGTWPFTENCPDIPYQALTPQHYLYDLVYNPSETEFLRRGRQRGAHVKNGLEMLRLQAEASWQIWQHLTPLP